MSSSSSSVLDPTEYTVAWIAPLPIEAQAALGMLDVRHQGQFPFDRDDDCVYLAGEICGHRVVIATSAAGKRHRKRLAGALAGNVKKLFTNLRFGLLVGVAAGLPNLSRHPPRDIRLGDVLVGLADDDNHGLHVYNPNGETEKGIQPHHYEHVLVATAPIVKAAIEAIRFHEPYDIRRVLPFYETFRDKEHPDGKFDDPGQHRDVLFNSQAGAADQPAHRTPRLQRERTRVWYGQICSAGDLRSHAQPRNTFRDRHRVIGLMEAVGTTIRIPVGVIRGVCHYGDHKQSEEWQAYAVAMAASYAKAVLNEIPVDASTVIGTSHETEDFRKSICSDEDLSHSPLAITQAEPPTTLQFPASDRPVYDKAADLTGLGTGYETEDIRKSICSDEDLDIGPFTSPAVESITQTGYSIREYADPLQSVNKKMSRELWSGEFSGNTTTYDSNSARTTMLLSQIQSFDEDTIRLLDFLSCIESNDIPESILPKPKSQKTKLAVTKLCESSFLRRRDAGDIFDMDRLVRAAVESRMGEQHRTRQVVSLALPHLAKVFPENYFSRDCMAYLPHALYLLRVSEGNEMKERYELFNRVGNFLRRERRLEGAIDCHEKAYQWASGPHNQDDGLRSTYQHNLAVTYGESGRAKDAIHLLENLVESQSRMLAEDGPDRLKSETELAIAYLENGRAEESIRLLESIVEIRTMTLPEDHFDRLASQHQLAKAYFENGQVRNAIRLLEATAIAQTSSLDPDDLLLVASQRQLAKAYHHDRQFKREIVLLEPLVEAEERIHTTDHPMRLTLENELAVAYMSDQRNDEAIKLFESLVTIHTSTLEEGHPARSILDLRVEPVPGQSLPDHKRAWGSNHISILDMVNNLGMLYESKGQLDQAHDLFFKALQGYELARGPDHLSTLSGLSNLAYVLEKQGNVTQARQLYQRALDSYRSKLGPLHAETVRATDRLAALSNSQGKLAEEEQLKASMLSSTYIETLPTQENVIESSSITSNPSYQTSMSGGHVGATASTKPTSVSNDIPAGFVLDPQKPPEGSDIESLPSDKDDIQSQDSRHTTPREFGSKRLLGEALLEEQQFRELCDEALRRMEGHRFAENVRRLLKLFYKELSVEAQSRPQKATVGLLRSRRGRYNIGQHVHALLQQDPEVPIKTDPEEKQSIENWLQMTYPSTQEDEEAWLDSAAGPEEMDGTSDSDLESDDDSVGGSENDLQEPFPAISDLSSFLRESKAFRVLLEHFTSLFVPFQLRELVQSVPRDRIEFSYEQDCSAINQFKLWMEKQTGSPWNWWPFAQPKRVLRTNEVRILWRCNCGEQSWDEISVDQSRWVKKLQALSDSTVPSPCWCPLEKSSSGIALKNLPRLQLLSGGTTSTGPQAVIDAQNIPNHAPAPSATAERSTPSQTRPHRPEVSSTTSEMMEQGRLGSIERHWVLFGVQGPRPARIPGEVAVETSTTDYHFFKSLKGEYAKHRGRIRLWFSLWQLEYFEFAEFQRLTPKRMVLERSGLPPQPGEYDYIRRHTGNDLQIQPVSRHVFKSFLESCSDPCRLSWFFPHDCDTFKGGDSNLKRIPKRNRSFINDETTEIWGLGTIYHLSCIHVITYHLIMVGGPMAFFAWWMVKFPGDLQNASVPVTIALGFLSLFWGILISFKDVS